MVKNPPVNTQYVRDTNLIPGLGRSSGGANGILLQDSCWENPMDRGAWRATFHGVAKELDMTELLSTYRDMALSNISC